MLPAYPVWEGEAHLEPAEPANAYVWDGSEWVLRYPYLNKAGAEVNDPTPMEPPLGYMKQPSLADQIRMAVLSQKLADEVAAQGMETFEEADDFEVGDDYDPSSPWENEFDPDYRDIVNEVARLRAKGVTVPDQTSQDIETLTELKGGARPSSTTEPEIPLDAKPAKVEKTK